MIPMNPNDFTDKSAMVPIKVVTMKTATSYNEPGLPTPPAGWGRKLSLSEEAMEKNYPDLYDVD